MKNISILLFALLLLPGCLKAKKSPFDFNSPGGFIFGFVVGSQGSQTFSLGGNITGFTSGSLVLQNNGQNDLTITAPTDKYSFSGLSSGATYLISVKSHPTGMACTLTKSKGTISASITDAHINCTAATANALYTLGDATKSYWLDYVKSDGTSPLDATGTACTGSETGYYNACIHAGEFKKISIPNITSCDGITATDSLSAFNWKCVVASDGSVSVISTGLRGDKGLTDLIDFTSPGSFRNNTVTVLLNSNSLLTSATGKWWDNSISINDSGGVLSSSKTIYLITSGANIATDYRMNSVDKVALITKPGVIKSTTAIQMVTISNKFLWIEGAYNNQSGGNPNYILNGATQFSMFRKLSLTGDTNTLAVNINLASNIGSLFQTVRISNVNKGFNANAKGTMFNQISISNSSNNSFDIAQADMIIMNTIVNSGATFGISSTSSGYSNNLYLNTTSLNFNTVAIILSPGGGSLNRTTYLNLLAGNSNVGITNSGTQFTKYINAISAENSTQYSDSSTPATSDSLFYGILKVTGNVCSALASSPGLGASCNKLNGSETNPATVLFSSIANSFVGQITSTDSQNSSNANGVSAGVPTDWFNFSNFFRNFGVNGTFNAAIRGNCTTNCRIWDWSLKSTDTVARNVNACPDKNIVDTHQWSDTSAPNQAYCDANYKGSKLNGSTCVTTFLRNAVEILGDGVGNENGICESSEECLYTPNIGAYQGHSSDSTNSSKLIPASQASTTTTTCPDVTTGGTITNVKLWKYDTNGY
jgi:hypothetical protein